MRAKRNGGFSLLEILAVLVVVAIVVGGASAFIAAGDRGKAVDNSVEKFVRYANFAAEYAIMSGNHVGLLLEPPAWRENPLSDGWRMRWQKCVFDLDSTVKNVQSCWKDVDGLEAIELPPEMDVLLLIDDQEVLFERPQKKDEVMLPFIQFSPSGEVTPFELEFTHRDLPGESETVLVNVWGDVVWQEREQENEERQQLLERFD